MAKTTGTQSIPSALVDNYRGALGEQDPNKSIRKRYPYRVPTMQTIAGHPSKKQKAQRARFNAAKDDFADLTPEERTRWYENEPEYGSLLWYYNYFIMSSLTGNANIPEGGAGVIKSIQHKLITIPAGGGEGQVAIDAINTDKAVVMVFGGSAIVFEGETAFAVISVQPYVSSLAAELVKCKWSMSSWGAVNTQEATISIIVIEYI